MAAIRIPVPGGSEIIHLVLQGSRITIGSLAANDLQILAEGISPRHAELIAEGPYYRLHDLDSARGIFVNGEGMSDYVLRESCKLGFGPLEFAYMIELPAQSEKSVVALPYRLDLAGNQLDSVGPGAKSLSLGNEADREEVRKGGRDTDVQREQFEAAVVELERLKASAARREGEMAALRAEHALVVSERNDLRRSIDKMKSEFALALKHADFETLRTEYVALQSKCDRLEQALGGRNIEIETLRRRLTAESPATGQAPIEEQSQISVTKNNFETGQKAVSTGMQLEEALGKLGFVVRPLRRDSIESSSRNGSGSESGKGRGETTEAQRKGRREERQGLKPQRRRDAEERQEGRRLGCLPE